MYDKPSRRDVALGLVAPDRPEADDAPDEELSSDEERRQLATQEREDRERKTAATIRAMTLAHAAGPSRPAIDLTRIDFSRGRPNGRQRGRGGETTDWISMGQCLTIELSKWLDEHVRRWRPGRS